MVPWAPPQSTALGTLQAAFVFSSDVCSHCLPLNGLASQFILGSWILYLEHVSQHAYTPLCHGAACCFLHPSLIPSLSGGREQRVGVGKLWFSTVCKIKWGISPRVHLHRENAQPHLHILIMTTAINTPSHRLWARCEERGDSAPCRQQSHGSKEHHQTHLVQLRVDQPHQGGPSPCYTPSTFPCSKSTQGFPCAPCWLQASWVFSFLTSSENPRDTWSQGLSAA